MKTFITINKIGNKQYSILFNEFNATTTIHAGKHINSLVNWSRIIGDGRSSFPKEKEISINRIIASKMVNMIEGAKDKYRLEIELNGRLGYNTTSEMNINEDTYFKVAYEGERIGTKANRLSFIIK